VSQTRRTVLSELSGKQAVLSEFNTKKPNSSKLSAE